MNKALKAPLSDFFEQLSQPSEEQQITNYAHLLMADYLIEIEKHMLREKISKKKLAKLLDVSPSYISQVFVHNKFINFKTLSKIAHQLDFKYAFHQKPVEQKAKLDFSPANIDSWMSNVPTASNMADEVDKEFPSAA
jgi:DNA-binding Xre family transcriptional regulator